MNDTNEPLAEVTPPALPSEEVQSEAPRTDLTLFGEKIEALKSQIASVIVGQEYTVDLVLTAILANGHVLIEGVPGVAKTLLARLTARLIDADFSRIQFTPDLMPSDVLGTTVFNMKTNEFDFHRGPVFADMILVDEINRAPAKTQSALFEVMEERQVSIDGTTYRMGELYTILATQNPVEQEGTYKLPEAQLDRFLFKVLVKFPDRQELREIVELTEGNHPPKIAKVMDRESLLAARACVAQIPIADAVMDYILDLVMATHADNPYIREGASPRAAQALIRTARARAFMENRLNVSFEDVKCVALPVLRHRILLSFDAVSEGITEDAVIGQILTEKEQGLYA